MVPAIRNILGGFLFSGDDVYKHVRVLSGGERTRLAVARMLLRPSNVLLLDEPTNHLDLDSKEVLLDALVDYGGTLVFVSHDRYFVERLATKIIEVGNGTAVMFPGTYKEFLWHKSEGARAFLASEHKDVKPRDHKPSSQKRSALREPQGIPNDGKKGESRDGSLALQKREKPAAPKQAHEEKKRADAEARKKSRELQARQQRPSARSSCRCQPPGSTTIARRLSRSSTVTRPSCGRSGI